MLLKGGFFLRTIMSWPVLCFLCHFLSTSLFIYFFNSEGWLKILIKDNVSQQCLFFWGPLYTFPFLLSPSPFPTPVYFLFCLEEICYEDIDKRWCLPTVSFSENHYYVYLLFSCLHLHFPHYYFINLFSGKRGL